MKVLICLLSFAALTFAVSVHPANKNEAELAFREFVATYQKVYGSDEEYNLRFRIFKDNLALIEKLNAVDTATYGVNKFADLTQEEFSKFYLRRNKAKMGANLPLADLSACAAEKIFPENCKSDLDTFDWRTKGAVTPIKDQGQCGSCWSFGTTGDIEGSWFLAKNKLISLSEQMLVSCDTKGENEGCDGGLQESAFDYIIKEGGIMSESDYPYVSGNGEVPKCQLDKSKFVAHISSWVQVSNSSLQESKIAPYLAKNGPVTIGINSGPMQFYQKGISDPKNCSPSDLDHAVLIVGYGSENSTDYWLIKNTWGVNWGEKGYYRIVRGVNRCGVAEDAVHSVV